MNEGVLLTILLALVGLMLVGLIALALIIFKRLPKSDANGNKTELSRIADRWEQVIRIIKPLVGTGRRLDNPITRLTFTESFDIERFVAASEESALANVNALLKGRSGDGILMTVSKVNLRPNGALMTVSASRKGQVLLDNGKAVFARHGQSGRYLPVLKDARTGKIIEQLKGVPVSKALSRLGAMSSAAIGAAHIVAGADIAKRLKQVESKLNLVMAYHRIEQVSILERIYTSAKELSSGPMNREKCWELWRLRGELRELRFNWRHELQHHLNLIDDPKDASWFKRMFARVKTSDKQIKEKITEGELQIGLSEYSMRLDNILAVASGTVNEFKDSLAGELSELDDVANLLESKSELISKKYSDLSVNGTVEAMKSVVTQYRELLSVNQGTPLDQNVLPGPGETPAEFLETKD